MIKITPGDESLRIKAANGNTQALDVSVTERTMTASLHLPDHPVEGQALQLDVGRLSEGRAYVVFHLADEGGFREVAAFLPRPMLVLLQDAIEEVLEDTGRGERTYP